MKIRTIQVEDAENYIELIKSIDGQSPFMIRQVGEFNKNKETIEKQIDDLADEDYFVVLEDVKISGYLKLSRSKKVRLQHKAELTIGILEDQTGKGHGKALMQSCIDWCKDNGIERLDLKVAQDNIYAIRLYKHFDFIQTGVYLKDVKLGDQNYLDFIHMSLHIDHNLKG